MWYVWENECKMNWNVVVFHFCRYLFVLIWATLLSIGYKLISCTGALWFLNTNANCNIGQKTHLCKFWFNRADIKMSILTNRSALEQSSYRLCRALYKFCVLLLLLLWISRLHCLHQKYCCYRKQYTRMHAWRRRYQQWRLLVTWMNSTAR